MADKADDLIPPVEQIHRAIDATAKAGVYNAFKAGKSYEEAMANGLVAASGAVGRLVMNAGREAVVAAAAADERAVGWQRVTGGSPCAFCAMLASRGPVYKQETVDFEAHDHCSCTAEPVFDADAWGEQNEVFDEMWRDAASELGHAPSPQEWRQYYESHRPVETVKASAVEPASEPTVAELPSFADDEARYAVATDELDQAGAVWTETLSAEQRSALLHYTSQDWSRTTPEEFALIREAIRTAPVVRGTVWRGITETIGSPETALERYRAAVGSHIQWKGIASSSLDPAIALQHTLSEGRMRGFLFEVASKSGRYITQASTYDDEAEVLFSDSRFIVRGVKDVPFEDEYGDLHIHTVVQLEEL